MQHPFARTFFIVVMLASGCRQETAPTELQEVVSPSVAGEQGFKLAAFSHDITSGPVRAFAAQVGVKNGATATDVGCQRASQWFVMPKQMTPGKESIMAQSVRAIVKSDHVYQSMSDELVDPYWTYKHCQVPGGSWPVVVADNLAGMKKLRANATDRGYELTVVVVDGDASLLTPNGALADSRTLWREKLPAEGWRVWHVKLAKLSDTANAPAELLVRLAELSAAEPAAKPRAYLFWAEGLAGNIVLDALSGNADAAKAARNATAAVITVGSPIGGLLTSQLAAGASVRTISAANQLFANTAAQTGLTVMKAYLSPVLELQPAKRQEFLLQEFKNRDYAVQRETVARPFGNKIVVLHVASLADLGDLVPLPLLSLSGGNMALVAGRQTIGHAAVMGHLPMFMNYPLSDGVVAMQHAVIPREAQPKDLKVELAALLRLDHFSLSLTSRDMGLQPEVPYVEIVDAILDHAASRL